MNSFLCSQYENLLCARSVECYQKLDTVSYELTKQIEAVPPGYKIGIQPASILLMILIANKITQTNPDVVVDIGSGKGHLARFLANYFHYRVLCVDSINDRLKSTIKWDRLINDSNIQQNLTVLQNNNVVSNNVKILNVQLESLSDFKVILSEAKNWSQNITKDGQLTIVAVKNCGDMIYNLLDMIPNFNSIKMQLLIVPCCFEKISQFPKSQKLKINSMAVEICGIESETVYLMDMMFYAEEKGLIVDVQYEFDGYFSFFIKNAR